MSINSRAASYGKVFGDWTLNEMLGQGSNGKTAVFRLNRNNRTFEEICAMKVVNIIEHKGSYESLSQEFIKDFEIYRDSLCDKAENEIKLMNRLGGSGNIVSYHDYHFANWEDDKAFGTDLLMRMDKLESLGDIKVKEVLEESEIIKIGIDISSALICCHKLEIIHRDIKPDNIFRNSFGDYLLGDFGISKMLENSSSAETRTGTESYAAPEQFIGNYNTQVDIYSLGLSLYELANGNKLPFAKSSFVSPEDIQRRLSGEELPMPEHVGKEFGKVILKACAYKCDERYSSADELKAALEELVYNRDIQRSNAIENNINVNHENIDNDNIEYDPYATVAVLTNRTVNKKDKQSDDYSDVLQLEEIYVPLFDGKEFVLDNTNTGEEYLEKTIIDSYVISDVGMVRKVNEDNYNLCSDMNKEIASHHESGNRIENKDEWKCFAVYDGIGGAECGELASKYAAEVMKEKFTKINSTYKYEEIDKAIREAYLEANNRIVEARSETSISGTTGTVVVTDGIMVKVFHVGDSRAYLLRNGELFRLTKDQTLAQMKVDAGFCKSISEAGEKAIHQLTEYIGRDTSGKYFHPVEGQWIYLKNGDLLLLCTDGVYDECNSAQIKKILSQNELTIKERVNRLVGLSLKNGGEDNITCMIIEKKTGRLY